MKNRVPPFFFQTNDAGLRSYIHVSLNVRDFMLSLRLYTRKFLYIQKLSQQPD